MRAPKEPATCQLHPDTHRKHALSTGTVGVFTFWQLLMAPVLAWAFARNPPNAQGLLGWARSRLGRALVLGFIGSFSAALGYDDRDVQDGLFVVGCIDVAFAVATLVSYACVSSGGPYVPAAAAATSGDDALSGAGAGAGLSNPFGQLQGEE